MTANGQLDPWRGTLDTRWINAEGAGRIAREVGLVPDPVPALSIASRDREGYLRYVLFELAYAVAKQSANPAASAEESADEDDFTPAERQIYDWAVSSSAALELLLQNLG